MTRVKICGITRLEDAQLAVELGAAALGFNFYKPSPRYLTPAKAAVIIRQLPPFVTPVGIFADQPSARRVVTLARAAGVAAVQLHGPRFPSINAALARFRLIRAVQMKDRKSLDGLGRWAAAYLLDGFHPKLRGGTGNQFDWKLARTAKKLGTIILAGGLTPKNVEQAIRLARPYAVDVASGVESAPGIKDPKKVRAFFAAVRKADKHLRVSDSL